MRTSNKALFVFFAALGKEGVCATRAQTNKENRKKLQNKFFKKFHIECWIFLPPLTGSRRITTFNPSYHKKMARILTGIQSTGVPHLGNILGAMLPAIEMSNNPDNESFLFIADMHSLTAIHDRETLANNTRGVAAAWLALGLDVEKTVFYRQSRVPECTELAWYLNCFMPFSRLELAHSFKDKAGRTDAVNAGLFTYPVLMASDILLYDADVVPVGKDQVQHLEFTRSLARKINNQYGEGVENSILIEPEAKLQTHTMNVPGIDGEKMSKSYNNTINVLSTTNKELKKQVNSIVSDSTPLEDPKPIVNNVTNIFELLASKEQLEQMQEKLKAGGYGWGHAKKELLELLLSQFEEAREKYQMYMSDEQALESKLRIGEEKAREIAAVTLDRVRKKLGYR